MTTTVSLVLLIYKRISLFGSPMTLYGMVCSVEEMRYKQFACMLHPCNKHSDQVAVVGV